MVSVKDIVYKLAGMLVSLHVMITVYGYAQQIVDLDVSKVADLDALVVHHAKTLVMENLQVEVVLTVDLKEDVRHLVNIIAIRIVLDGDVDPSVE